MSETPQPVVFMTVPNQVQQESPPPSAGPSVGAGNGALFHCTLCVKSFPTYISLRRHQGCKHGRRTIFSCTFCLKTFTTRGNLSRHKTIYHAKEKLKREGTASTIKCGVCTALFRTTEALCLHLRKIHCFDVNMQKFHFSSREELHEWRTMVETEGCFEFVNRSGKNQKKEYLRCHRSGMINSKTRGLRQPRTKGSRRIDFHCSAFANVTYLSEDDISVLACLEHYGHDTWPITTQEPQTGEGQSHVTQNHAFRARNVDELVKMYGPGCRKVLRQFETRHKESRNLFRQQFIRFENGWQVASEDIPGETYFIRKNREICECRLRCRMCQVCPHLYTCSCPDALKTHTVCKHQHYVHAHFDLESHQEQHLMAMQGLEEEEQQIPEEQIVVSGEEIAEENQADVIRQAVTGLDSEESNDDENPEVEETPDISLPVMEIDVFTSADENEEKRVDILNRWSQLMNRLPYCSDFQLEQLSSATEKLEEITSLGTWEQQAQDTTNTWNLNNDQQQQQNQQQQNSYRKFDLTDERVLEYMRKNYT